MSRKQVIPDLSREDAVEALEKLVADCSVSELSGPVSGVLDQTDDPRVVAAFPVFVLAVTAGKDATPPGSGSRDTPLGEQLPGSGFDDERARFAAHVMNAVLAVARGLFSDSDEWEAVAESGSEERLERVLELLDAYEADEDRREAFGRCIEATVGGDPSAVENPVFQSVADELGVDERQAVVRVFLNLREVVTTMACQSVLRGLRRQRLGEEQLESVRGTDRQFEALLDPVVRLFGFRRIDELYYRVVAPQEPLVAWEFGLQPADVHAGYAIERDVVVGDREFDPEAVADALADPDDTDRLLVLGRPGAGKTTFCLSVIDEWVASGRGPVLYRPSGMAAITDTRGIEAELFDTDDHVLVVIDDVTREETASVADLLETFATDSDVSFLLNTRTVEFDAFEDEDLAGTEESLSTGGTPDRTSLSDLQIAEIAPLSIGQCHQFVAQYESAFDFELELDPESLLAELWRGHPLAKPLRPQGLDVWDPRVIRSPSSTRWFENRRLQPPGLLLLQYRLAGRIGPRGELGSRIQVIEYIEEVIGAVVSPDDGTVVGARLQAFDREVRETAAFVLSLVNATPNLDVNPAFVVGLAHVYDIEYARIVSLVECLEGWLYFIDDGSSTYTSYHSYWWVLCLRYLLVGEDNELSGSRDQPMERAVVHERFTAALTALRAVTAGEIGSDEVADAVAASEHGQMIEEAFASAREMDTGEVVTEIFELVRAWPLLARLFQRDGQIQYDPGSIAELSPETLAELYVMLGRASRRQGDVEAAEAWLERSERLLASVSDAGVEASRLIELGNQYRLTGSYDRALETFREARRIAAESGALREQVRARNYEGVVFRWRGEDDAARDAHEKALSLARSEGIRELEASTLNNLGWVVGDAEEAWELHRESLFVARGYGPRSEEARAYRSFGILATRREEFELAREYFKRALSVYCEVGDVESWAWTQLRYASVLENLGYSSVAYLWVSEAIDRFEGMGYRYGLSQAYQSAIRVMDAMNADKIDERVTALDRLCEVSAELDDGAAVARFRRDLGKIERKRGNRQESIEALEEALSRYEEVNDHSQAYDTLLGLIFTANELESDTALERYVALSRTYAERNGIEAPKAVGLVHLVGGLAALSLEREDRAVTYLERAVKSLRGTDASSLVAHANVALGKAAFAAGEIQQGRDAFDSAIISLNGKGSYENALDAVKSWLEHERDGSTWKFDPCYRGLEILDHVEGRADADLSEYRAFFESKLDALRRENPFTAEEWESWITFTFEFERGEAAESFEDRVEREFSDAFAPAGEPISVDCWDECVYVQTLTDAESDRERRADELVECFAHDWNWTRAAILTMDSNTGSGRTLVYERDENGDPVPIQHLRGNEGFEMLDVIMELLTETGLRVRATATGDPGGDRFIMEIRRADSSNFIDLVAEVYQWVVESDVERLPTEWESF